MRRWYIERRSQNHIYVFLMDVVCIDSVWDDGWILNKEVDMSIRAHLVTKIEYTGPVFNLWHDENFVNFLDKKGLLHQLNEDLCGFLEISRDTILEYIEQVNGQEEKDERDGELVTEFKQLLEQYPDKDYFLFYCF